MIYVATKQYTCCLCSKPIPKGHKYWKRGKLHGKQHLNCCDYETPIADAMAEKRLREQLSILNGDLYNDSNDTY